MPDQRKLIVVLGPHRSGTSLCTAALESLGAQLRLPEYYTNEENPRGFFEHPDIVDFNDRLLAYLGGAWDNALFQGAQAMSVRDLTAWRAEAVGLFSGLFAECPVVAVKDPRLCQLLGFWLSVFADCGYAGDEIFFVHVLRDPVEAALSQRNRAVDDPLFYEVGRELEEGAALWLSLTAQALEQSLDGNNFYVSYAAMLSEPAITLDTMADFIGLQPDVRRVETFCADFVTPALHRSVANGTLNAALQERFPQAPAFYRGLKPLFTRGEVTPGELQVLLDQYHATDTGLAIARVMAPALSRLSERSRRDSLEAERRQDTIADLENQVSEHESLLPPLRDQISRLEKGNASLQEQTRNQLAEMENQQRTFEYTIGAMEASTSWRISRPIRWLGEYRNQLREVLVNRAATFRLRSIYIYQRMSVRHPRFAWAGRVTLRPLFRVISAFLSRNGSLVSDRRFENQSESMRYQAYENTEDYRPLVSIVVPNYNHAEFLSLRLDSIYSQTYQNFEVILLDDASTDNSTDVLTKYQQRYPASTTLLINDENSGGVFHQWEKGLKAACGDIVWIAESDDWCSENFLEVLVPYFENEAIQLAYSKTVFMNAADEQHWSIREYLHDIDPDRWSAPIVASAHTMVADAFAIKNIVPNVSSALFRNPQSLELLADTDWKNMRTCGDWIFYLHLIRGGALAYSPDASNYYRIHGDNTSVASYSQDVFYREHEEVAKTVQRYFRVDAEVFRRQRDILIAHWRETREDYTAQAFDACYSLDRIEQVATERTPNLLMASYGFCTGGGETFPVELANLMKASDYNVTYLDCAQEPRNEGVRGKLRADIPVVSDLAELEKIVREMGIDIIHSHHAWVDSSILDILPEDTPCRTVVTLHGMYETINSVDLKFILPRLARRSASLIYVADKNLMALTQHKLVDKVRLVRIENALSDNGFEPIERATLDIPEEAFVVTLISRAMAEKGWQEGIEIVTQARLQSDKDIHLLLVGDGLEYNRLSELELPPFVHLEGFQTNVRGYFALSDMGFLPSKFRGESFPMVVIECLQSGRPFMSSTLGDIPYMLGSPDGPAGVLIDLHDTLINTPAWAEQVATLAADKQAYRALVDRVPAAAAKFDASVMAHKHDEVYRSVL
ncbi:glycosyltransferase [Candidatus Marimicrobium litorale]|uniref:Glycosyltransferase n=1 Tax=Candidatus Marimicrobium litorale TaxID=2518991 RepID=A0ABT3T6W1_9GAMM|nr:glycosyltransferase [Candidatus Marimicrobium litorale]MCX2977551.1 glycosyltransferase [Candidatus Marimicrobium litorale]